MAHGHVGRGRGDVDPDVHRPFGPCPHAVSRGVGDDATVADGEAVTFEHPMQSSPPPFGKGDRVRVFYAPDAPQVAVAPNGLALVPFGWSFPALAGLAVALTGAALLLVGALPWVSRRNARS